MIYVKLGGRLGNQMFRYAFVRWLQKQGQDEGDELVLDLSVIQQEHKKGEMPGWEDSLQHFRTIPYRYYEEKDDFLKKHTGPGEKAVLAVEYLGERLLKFRGAEAQLNWQRRFLSWQNRHGLYLTTVGCDWPFAWSDRKIKIISGSYECARYPEEIRGTLLEEFTPRLPLFASNKELMEKICSTNSVCVTIRRGNFLQYPALNVCNGDYFCQAAQRMRELSPEPVFFVFSDDIDWVRGHLAFPGETYYESGRDPVWEKLRLMSACRHFIISNSTFSWWAQFLGRSEDKIVIAPDHWFNVTFQPPLYEEGWHLIPAERGFEE